jgi:hypothetical protein
MCQECTIVQDLCRINPICKINELSQKTEQLATVDSWFDRERQLHKATAKYLVSQSPDGHVIVHAYAHQSKKTARQLAAWLLLNDPEFLQATKQ